MAANPAPPRQLRNRSQMTREMVVGWSRSALAAINARQTLPRAIDDLQQDLGLDIYERMLKDSQVQSCVTILKAAILEEGVTLNPGVSEKDDPDYQLAVRIRDIANDMFDALDPSLESVLWDMADSVALGNRVSELIFQFQQVDGRQLLMLRSMKPKPNRSVLFVTDAYLNIIGFTGDLRGGMATGATTTVLNDESILPREKFAVDTFRPRNSDPRGTSVLNAAYDPWNRKRQTLKEWLTFMAICAVPILIGYTGEQAGMEPLQGSLGQLLGEQEDPDDDDEPSTLETEAEPGQKNTPEQDMVLTLMELRNATAAAFPFGYKVDKVEVTGNGQVFERALNEQNTSITKAILTQVLATEQGQYQARAAAEIHMDVLDTIIRQGKRSKIRMLYYDVLRNWTIWNWGPQAARLAPYPSLGTTERRDLASMFQAVGNLHATGYPSPSQYPTLDRLLGLPQRDPSEGAPPVPALQRTESSEGSDDDRDESEGNQGVEGLRKRQNPDREEAEDEDDD